MSVSGVNVAVHLSPDHNQVFELGKMNVAVHH